MITDVSLRLLYLIVDRFLNWLMLFGRLTHVLSPGTGDAACRNRI
jgi:hypothetical protein